MKIRDVGAFKNWPNRIGYLLTYQGELTDNAIRNLEHGNDYRAEDSLKTITHNYRDDSNSNAADAVERLL